MPMEYLDRESFLGIFVSAALVILFGAAYVGIFTVVKMRLIHAYFMTLAYLSWCVQAYSMYVLGVLIKSEPFTQKVLMGAMVGYFLIPHAIYYLVVRIHDKYEPHSH